MQQSQLVELIKCLTEDEKQHVLSFSSISFFNNGRMRAQVAPLLEICLFFPWHSSTQNLEKKEVYQKIFPNQVFVQGKLEKVMVDAHKLIRAYLMTQFYFREENEFYQCVDISEITRSLGLDARHEQMTVKLQKIQEASKIKNEDYFYRQFLLEQSIHLDACFHNQKKGDLNIPNTLNALELHFYSSRLALLNRFLLQQKEAALTPTGIVKLRLEEDSIPESYLEASSLLRINFEINKRLKKTILTSHDVDSLFDLLKIHEDNLDQESLQEFYAYLRNLCVLILNNNPDQESVRLILHELQKHNLERGYLHYEGKLHPSRIMSIADNAIRIKNFDWILTFLDKYKDEIIGENESRDIFHFIKAKCLFEMGRFEDCLDNIPPTSHFADYQIQGKRLELKALYELQSDLLSYKLDAFKMFISRTSHKLVSITLRQTHADFANLLDQLVRSRPGDKKRAEVLVRRVEEKKHAAEYRWLLAKATALGGK